MTRKAAWAGGAYGAALLLAAAYRSELNVVLLLTAFGLAALVFAALKNYRRHAVVCFVFFAAGILVNSCYTHFVYDRLTALDGQTVTIKGHITELSQIGGQYERVLVSGKADGISTEISFVLPADDFHYYDEITVTDTVNVIEGSISFDSDEYYYSKSIFLQGGYATCSYELGGRSVNSLFRGIREYRDKLFGLIVSVCPGREGAFLGAMLCGDKSAMTPSMKTMLYRSGLGHIFAVSGIHLVIAVSFFSFFAGKLIKSKHIVFILTLAEIWGFAVFAGLSVSVVRAAVMFTFTRTGSVLGRKSDGLNSLGLCALLLLTSAPYSAVSPSFVLSFLAVLAIEITILSSEGKEENKVDSSVKMSVSVLFVTAPASAGYFGGISVMSVVTNLLLVPLCTISLQLCCVVLILGGNITLSRPVIRLASLPVRFVLYCSDKLAALDISYVFTSSPAISALVIVSCAVMVVYTVRVRDKKRYLLAVITVFAVWSAASQVCRAFDSEMTVTVLPGGRKTAYVVTCKGSAVVFDVGCHGKLNSAVQRQLENHAVRRIKSAFISERGVLTASAYEEDIYPVPQMIFINDDPLFEEDSGLIVLENGSSADIGSIRVKAQKNGYEIEYEDNSIILGKGNITINGKSIDISDESSVLELKGTTLRRL
ncbi:ComEC/Rec2 family competence protein [uncultured Ruminococcus sp.]|uniref:ComEC/Rec2 family competence protein n=1 Tax=uncultured Ruminococcus sp. TaxID=165186 RepID=UPI0025D528B6|nr:ComEC/Rec2 family competence protein [uncultured Ruminococcus sp.]